MPSPIRTLHATCHCRTSALSFTLPRASLPLPVHFCHCSICRKTHGTLFSAHAPIPCPDANLDAMSSYKSSDHVTKWFCKTCGAHMLDRVNRGDVSKWYVAVSLVDAEEEVWKYTGHHFVEGTADGGLAVMLRKIGSVEMGVWKERRLEGVEVEEKGDWSLEEDMKNIGKREDEDMLRARCHCRAVDFWIFSPDGGTGVKLLLTKNTLKWSGRHCACNSCRTTTSSFISSWIKVPISALKAKDKTIVASSEQALFGTTYQSAKGVSRTFCAVCGTSVSYRREEEARVLQIAAGLLEGRGARMESHIAWLTEVHNMEGAIQLQACQAFEMGFGGDGSRSFPRCDRAACPT
ncbi:Mss4-like protein [Phaeosphaeria sp. MPI-PUGE-AT-0046c]|nr:Mss4-like protein [Phaeosphaeria sp. MPI-PUGE-AT-0046c]